MFVFLVFTDTATTDIYTLSLHDALPISEVPGAEARRDLAGELRRGERRPAPDRPAVELRISVRREARERADELLGQRAGVRSEEHTSELQSLTNLVCRLLLEKKK